MKILKVIDLGDDVLEVTGLDDNGQEVTAKGWVSAMITHYDADDYYQEDTIVVEEVPDAAEFTDGDIPENAYVGGKRTTVYTKGMLRPDATPRVMTKAEKE